MTNNPAFKNLSQINKKKLKLIYADEQFKKVLSPVPHIYVYIYIYIYIYIYVIYIYVIYICNISIHIYEIWCGVPIT